MRCRAQQTMKEEINISFFHIKMEEFEGLYSLLKQFSKHAGPNHKTRNEFKFQ